MKKVKAAGTASRKSPGKKKAALSPGISRPDRDDFPVVCLGGSAGSLKAYTQVVQEIPPDAGMAVVVISHPRKAPTSLPQILARHTRMPVELIRSGLKLRPNRVYVVPSNKELTMQDGAFQLNPPSEKRGWPTVITIFLESLAREWKGKTIAVILSGLDSDGVRALPAIKAAGGITFAQKIETAEQPSMPRQAVETGFVDFELTPLEIGREVGRIAHADALRRNGQGPKPGQEPKVAETGAQAKSPGVANLPEESAPAAPKAADFPIVGVGASAGGLEAFTLLLEHLPANTGMAFVLIQHLNPTHESQLTDILSRKCAMPVREVSTPTPVEPNHVYIIPPGKNLTIAGGILETVPRLGARNMPIDNFLEALGKDRQNGAFAVILSGTASDGTLGAKAVKAEGGITFAQEPSSAKFDGMPRSAIASGVIDFVLPPERIAKQLAELAGHSYPHAEKQQVTAPVPTNTRDLNRIFVRLRAATAIDFTYYKQNTILRRIKRRMALRGIENLDQYARLVEQDRSEATALSQDFLVNVTSFFREPESLEILRQSVFPSWIEGRASEDPIRIWIPGCSTGEEAYSLAIVLVEFLEEHGAHPGIQVFATDLSESVIEKARSGVYLESAVAGISPARLERFFVKRDRVYQVSHAIRELCVFARHDVTRDPPFSKMDLISCCNLLIYLGPVLQRKALALFHYSLKPNGFLVLGSSESAAAFPESFEPIDRKHLVYSKKGASTRLNFDAMRSNLDADMASRPRIPGDGTGSTIQKEADRILLAEYAPASVIIDDAMHVIQVRGKTDAYLQVPQGVPTTHLTPMVRPGLLAGLKTAVEEARKRNAPAVEQGLRIKENGSFREVDVRVSPIRSLHGEDRCFLVLFEDSADGKETLWKPAPKSGKAGKPRTGSSRATEQLREEIARLEHELNGTRDYLQSIIEAQEAAAEELRSANEEAQANNEELDTAKEELQASNEELTTVNEELRIRNAEQTSTNSDLRKLLESINVPLVMVGKDLRIRWFTAAMEPVLNLLPNDQGRLITDLRSTVIPDFMEMLVRALTGSQEKSVEFQRPGGGWLSLRILPYRGLENTIDGAIATLIDIDDLKRARNFAEAVVETVREPLVVLDANLRVRTANDAFYRIFELQKQETEGRLFYEIGSGQWDIPRLRELLNDLLPKQFSLRDFEVEHKAPDQSGPQTMLLNAREIHQQDGERMILLSIDDITELRRSTDKLRRTNEDLKQFIFAASHDLKEPLRMIVAHTQLLAGKYLDKLDSNGALSIQYAVEGALRLEALISGLREFWELSEGAEEKHTPVDCNEVLKKVLLNLEVSIAETKAKITSGPLPSLMASEATLIQLFQNLLANALKYRSQEPPVVHVSASKEGNAWVFSVRDNGIGVDSRYARQIFGVFKRLHAPDKYPGTGIGLAICQKIVERYGGRIWVEPRAGGGSEFRFSIPS